MADIWRNDMKTKDLYADKVDCCGCNVCQDSCPVHAITMRTDVEGFWYPEIGEGCIDCGLCIKNCPIKQSGELKKNEFKESVCFAAVHKNLEVRFDSTSGGVFSAFANLFYRQKGFVGGAVYNNDFSVSQIVSGDRKDLPRLRSSKYLQSNATGFYGRIQELLVAGERIVVCGTPCQMAGLRAFLGRAYENLLVLDFVCLGINSPNVFRKYLDYLEARFGSKVVNFKAKNKELGWRKLTSKITFANGEALYDTKDTSYFTKGYLVTNVFCRPSCYECRFKGFPRIADITLADFWGAEKVVGKDMDNDLGTSLVMINNAKGMSFFERIKETICFQPVPFDSILLGNQALVRSLPRPRVDRNDFYAMLDVKPFSEVAHRYIAKEDVVDVRQRARMKVRALILCLKRMSFVLKTCRFSIRAWLNLIAHNSVRSILGGTGGLVLGDRHVVMQIHPRAKLLLGGRLLFGSKPFKKSKLETRFLVQDGATVEVRGDFPFGYGADVEVFSGAELIIKGGGASNIGTTLICGEKIVLEHGVMIGRNVTIRDTNGGHYMSLPGYKNTKPVTIGEHAWLGEGCTIMPGVKIGRGAIVGAGAVVFNNVPAHALVVGNPAEVVMTDVYWKY